jgi:hypothetical protein
MSMPAQMLFEGVVQPVCEELSSQLARQKADASSNINPVAAVSVEFPSSMIKLIALALIVLSRMAIAMRRWLALV